MKRKRAAGGSRAAGGKMGSRERRSAVCSMGQLRAAKEKSGLAPAMAKEARWPGAGAGAGATRGRAAKQSADKAQAARDGASLREIERLLHLGQNQIIPKTRGCVQPGSLQEISSPRPAAEGQERERRADESTAGLAERAVAAATAGGRPALATGGASAAAASRHGAGPAPAAAAPVRSYGAATRASEATPLLNAPASVPSAPVGMPPRGFKREAVAADKQAMEMGKRLYLTYCMQCHGADARGAKGFPNLTDSDWLYGGEPDQIKETIAGGRMGVMPPHEQLGADTIKDLANFVRSLSGLPNDSVRAGKGKEAFTSAGCVGCHGPEATGMHAVGAPNLTDKVWLHGWGEGAIVHMVTNGKQNVMPAFEKRLSAEQINVLAAYVWNLSQGTAVAAAK